MKNLTGIIAIIAVIFSGLACSGDDVAKANELVDEANKFLTEANKSVEKMDARGKEFDAKVDSVKSDDDLKAVREMGKEMLAIYTSMQENFQKSGEKFAEAAKLSVDAKFKEYLDIKAQEMKKRSEMSGELKAIPKALDEAQNEKAYKETAAKIVAKVKQMNKEAGDLSDKADKIQKDNPTLIKQS